MANTKLRPRKIE